ncbi:MAG: hypothetical protein NT027_12565 [Proteobacteria bacterium]|nr:hypothetical protein [Pseudomonadota bacterium]
MERIRLARSVIKSTRIFICLSVVVLSSCSPFESMNSSQLKDTVGRDGGDQISCTKSADNEFAGAYTLDYFLTLDESKHPQLPDWEAYRDRIQSQLSIKFPELAESFRKYTQDLLKSSDAQYRIWKSIPSSELEDLSDEQVQSSQRKIPHNCLDLSGKPNLRQLVRREVLYLPDVAERKIFYFYDKQAMEELRVKSPLQFSYIVVHEWLWDFVGSAWANRIVNHVFQSESLTDLSASEIRQHLRAFGIESVKLGNDTLVSTEAERKIATEFASDPRCLYTDRFIVDFLPLGASLKLKGGQEKTLSLAFNNLSQEQLICGAAIIFSHKSKSPGNSLKVKIGRKNLVVPEGGDGFEFESTQDTKSESLFAHCIGRACETRLGQFSSLIGARTPINNSKWNFILKTQDEVEIINPVMMIIPRVSF